MAGAVGFYSLGKSDRAFERPVAHLASQEIRLLGLFLLFARALDCQDVANDLDIDVLGLNARKVSADDEFAVLD